MKTVFNFFYKLVANNFVTKLIAMFLTLVIWFIILSSKQVEAIKNVKIQYITPTGYTVSEAPKLISIKIRGPKAFIDEIMSKNKVIPIDLRNKQTGFVSYNLSKDMVKLPINVKILKIEPETIMPKIEKLQTKELKIKPSLVGNLDSNYTLKGIKLTPDKLTVTGPASYIEQLKTLETAPIDISKLKAQTTLKTSIDSKLTKKIPNLKGKLISVYLDISPVIINKIYRNIPVIIKGINNRRVKINPRKVDIVVKGPKLILDNLQELDIRANIDITFNAKGSAREELSIELPENISLISVNPSKISVWIY